MALHNEEGYERKLRPVYDALDARSYKQAIKLADAVLKKHSNDQLTRALKGYALHQNGKPQEALKIMSEIMAEGPEVERVVMTMAYTYKAAGQSESIMQGNLYLAGTVGLSFGLSKVKLGMNGAAWVLVKYTKPAEVVLSVEAGPELSLWDEKLTFDLKGLNQINADVRFKASGIDDMEFWLALTKRMDLKTLVAGIPAIGEKLADIMPAYVYMEIRLDVYANTKTRAAVRLTFETGVTLQGRAADVAKAALGTANLPLGFSIIAQAEFGASKFFIMFVVKIGRNTYFLEMPFCKVDSDCPVNQACQLFVCGEKLPRGGPCTRDSQCKSNNCATSRGLLFCVECTSDSECRAKNPDTVCDTTSFWDPTTLYTCKSQASCRKRVDGFAVTGCKSGYESILGGTTCRQVCYGTFSKSCGGFCTLPSRSCASIDTITADACPLQNFVNADQLCVRKIVSNAIPANKTSVVVGSDGLVTGAASYCPAGSTGVSSGLTESGQLRVQCAMPCPAYYPYACGGYCAIDSSVLCPPDPAKIQGTVAACDDFNKVKARVELASQTSWGTWGGYQICPGARSVTGFQIKLEDQQGAGVIKDDTAMNGVRMQCPSGQIITASNNGPWGTYRNWAFCVPGEVFYAARLRSEKGQGSADDTAINSLTMKCTNGVPKSSHDGWWGDQMAYSFCPGGAICGFQQRVEKQQGPGDDTALNGIRILCCDRA